MSARVKQLRDGVARLIDQNPTRVTYTRQPMVSNPLGGQVADPFGTPTTAMARVRISHERSGTPANQPVPAGADTSMSLYVLTDYRAPLREGDIITAESRKWRVGPVNVFKHAGQVYKTEAVLIPGDAT